MINTPKFMHVEYCDLISVEFIQDEENDFKNTFIKITFLTNGNKKYVKIAMKDVDVIRPMNAGINIHYRHRMEVPLIPVEESTEEDVIETVEAEIVE